MCLLSDFSFPIKIFKTFLEGESALYQFGSIENRQYACSPYIKLQYRSDPT